MSTSLATTRQRVLYQARELWQRGFVTFDTETTGLVEWEDQIIQWAVCSQAGEILGSGFVRPTVPISEGAFEKHGISEEQLADAPPFHEVWPKIRNLLVGKTVVIYNADFDIGMIRSSAHVYDIKIPYDLIKAVCAMNLFARYYGEVHDYFGTYTWQKLNEVAIPYLGIEASGQAHDAAHEATATAMIIKKLAELADQELAPEWHPPVLVACAGGCRNIVQECAEADTIWYCQQCGLREELFHRCPGCNKVVEFPATGFSGDDLCEYCHRKLHREMMLLTGAWHWCPDSNYHIVETSNMAEPCADCQRQRERRRKLDEEERERQVRREQERKEHKRLWAQDYRKRRRERKRQNAERIAQGLPPLEEPARPPVEAIFYHRGHDFQRRKVQSGKREVFCLICELSWSRPPERWCAGIKAYRDWSAIPEHLKTRTQLFKLHLQPAQSQKAAAMMEGSFDRYSLYDQTTCVPLERQQKTRKQTTHSGNQRL